MKKIFTILACMFGVLAATGMAEATVGGPTFIYNFKYNPVDESVYYVSSSNNGRGCPPVLMKMSLESGKQQTVYSCDQGEKLLSSGGTYDSSKVMNAINDMTAGFKSLSPINLKKNNIGIDVNFVKTEKLSPELDEIKNSVFSAIVYQNGRKLADMQINGCNNEQPFTFAGYAIPGFEKKIVLLVSTKSDCFEGGYTGESLHVLGGMDSVNRAYLNYYKGDFALTPNEGTLTVYEEDTISNKPQENGNEDPVIIDGGAKKIPSAILSVGVGIVALLIGFLLGRLTKRGV